MIDSQCHSDNDAAMITLRASQTAPHYNTNRALCRLPSIAEITKGCDTLRASQTVPHSSTNRALCRLTSEFRWDRVYSTQYGRSRHELHFRNFLPQRTHLVSHNLTQIQHVQHEDPKDFPDGPPLHRALCRLTSRRGLINLCRYH